MSLRLMVYDRTCGGRWGLPGLTSSWRLGAGLYRALGRLDDWTGAVTWPDALEWLAAVSPGEPIQEIQYWGHGHWGSVKMNGTSMGIEALDPDHPLHASLLRVRDRMTADSTWWFRTCETFGTQRGHEFARGWADFFGCRCAGHTYVIGPTQSGLHTLRPGELPDWPIDEGLPADWRDKTPTQAQWSRWSAPNTISCLHGQIPEGF